MRFRSFCNKPVCTLITTLAMAIGASAQSKYSVLADISLAKDELDFFDGATMYSNQGYKAYLEKTSSWGVFLGLLVRRDLGKLFFLESGFYLRQYQRRIDFIDLPRFNHGYFQTIFLPIHFGARLPITQTQLSVEPFAGMAVGLLSTGNTGMSKSSIVVDKPGFPYYEYRASDTIKRNIPILLTGGIGLAYRISKRIQLGLRARYATGSGKTSRQEIDYSVATGTLNFRAYEDYKSFIAFGGTIQLRL